jgi:hypothetical protein
LIFIVLPLVLGSIFLIKQLLFGKLKEDEFHHLRKKEFVRPHLDSNAPEIVSGMTTSGHVLNITNQAMGNDNDLKQDNESNSIIDALRTNTSVTLSVPNNHTLLEPPHNPPEERKNGLIPSR